MESPKRVLSEAGDAALVLLRLVEASSDAFPPLKSAAAGTLHIVELVKGFTSSKREWAAFGEYILGASLCVVDAIKASSESKDDLEGHAKELKVTLDAIAKQIVQIQTERPLRRLWGHSKAPQRIEGFKQQVREALELFQLKADVVTVRKLQDMPNENEMKRLLKEMGDKFSGVVVEEIRIHDAVERLPHLIDASWDSNKTCRCGTRVALIEGIWSWIQKADPTQAAGICLVKEIAGSGKSALANSVSARCEEGGVLFATFFFDQLVETKARPTYLFSTLAYQLTKLGQDYTNTLGEILSQDPLLYSPDQTRQFQRLILPAAKLAKRSHVPKPIVIVIDALDEGADETTLKILSELVPSLPGAFRFFITSRRTPELDYYLNTPAHVSPYSLDILGANNFADLQQYIEWRLPEIATYRRLGTEWVTPKLITDFAIKAEGLFIWAATVCEYLRDKYTFDPEATLQTLLYEKHDFGLPAEQKMAQLFDRILKPFDWSDDKFRHAFQQVLGTIVTAKVPLSPKTIQHFCPDIRIERILDHLMPLITGLDESNKVVKFTHLSFRDYLTSQARAEESFYINPQRHESRLAWLCLHTLSTDLKAGSPGTEYLDNALEGIPSVAKESIALHVLYACRFWIDHAIEITPNDSVLRAFLELSTTFLTLENMVRWLELTTAVGQFISLKSFEEWYLGVSNQEIWGGNDGLLPTYARAIFKLSLRLKYAVRLEEAVAASDEAVALYRKLGTDHPTAFSSDLALSLNNVSVHLSDLGRREEALTAIQEAVTLYREQAAECPAALSPDLAMSLINVSKYVFELGCPEEALATIQEAVTLYRQLAADRPAAFSSNLAMSLNNIAMYLSALGRREESLTVSQEAVTLYRHLAADRPTVFSSDLALSLINISKCLSELGCPEEALTPIQEAVALYRQLAADRPAAFSSYLATSLNNTSMYLSALGRPEDALTMVQEAVTLYQQLAADRPAAFSSLLALSLNNISTCLSVLGRPEEALTPINEAVTLYRNLAADHPAASSSDLARSLINASKCLSELGRPEEALTAIQEAANLYRHLAEGCPAAFSSYLAMSLNNVSKYLSDLGRPEEALTAIQEAVTIRRELAAERPAAFSPDLAWSLNSLSIYLSELGRPEEALTVIQEDITLYRQLAAERPAAFSSNLARSLNNVSKYLYELDRPEEALTTIQEAVVIRRQLATDRPAAFSSELASSLNNISMYLSALGRPEEALPAIQEAVILYRQLAMDRPAVFSSDLAMSLNNVARYLSILGRQDEALAMVEEAVKFYRQLAADRPAAFSSYLARSLNVVSIWLFDLGRAEDAVEAAKEAVSISRPLAHENPEGFNDMLAETLDTLSICSLSINSKAALEASEEAIRFSRPLARGNPKAFKPGFSIHLINLAKSLSSLGRPKEALQAVEEAVSIQRQLAADLPATFNQLLAESLDVLSRCMADVGREEEAQAFLSEASLIRGSAP